MTALGATLRFIVLEGGEGAGKSTQAKRLAQWLGALGMEVVLTREPGGTPAGERIRSLLVNGEIEPITPLTEALLINAQRTEHLEKVIRPALAQGHWVVCDRFADSTMAYQGYGQGADKKALSALRRLVVGESEPGLTIIFDLPVDVGLARVAANQRYERLGRAFHERLRQAFQEIAGAKDLERRLINASGSPDDVFNAIKQEVGSRFGIPV